MLHDRSDVQCERHRGNGAAAHDHCRRRRLKSVRACGDDVASRREVTEREGAGRAGGGLGDLRVVSGERDDSCQAGAQLIGDGALNPARRLHCVHGCFDQTWNQRERQRERKQRRCRSAQSGPHPNLQSASPRAERAVRHQSCRGRRVASSPMPGFLTRGSMRCGNAFPCTRHSGGRRSAICRPLPTYSGGTVWESHPLPNSPGREYARECSMPASR